jgi:hypothetical protein
MPIPNISDLMFIFIGGFLFIVVIIFAVGKPKKSVWIEHCPYCNAELGPKFKGERLTTCRKCKHDIYFTKPHGS